MKKSFWCKDILIFDIFKFMIIYSHETALKEYGISLYQNYNGPKHSVINPKTRRNNNKGIIYHKVSKPLDELGIVKTRNEKYLSPEYTFLFMANQLDFINLTYLGMEFCSKKLTTLAKLNEAYSFIGRFKGMEKSKKALKYISEGSNSPMESILYLLLVLPNRHGGFGFLKPEMNFRIDLSSEEQAYCKRQFLVSDYYWSKMKLSVEYQSTTFHNDSFIDDEAKRTVMFNKGFEQINITASDLLNPEKQWFKMKTISSVFNTKLRIRTNKYYEKNQEIKNLAEKLIKCL